MVESLYNFMWMWMFDGISLFSDKSCCGLKIFRNIYISMIESKVPNSLQSTN